MNDEEKVEFWRLCQEWRRAYSLSHDSPAYEEAKAALEKFVDMLAGTVKEEDLG